MRKIDISLPSTGEEEWRATRESFLSGWLTHGPKVAAFEKAFADKVGVKHALAVTSCTTALHLALLALNIGPNDQVIVPAFTWVATANTVLYTGATPVFVDVDPKTYNLDPVQLKEAITEQTKAIIPVHLFGLCADIEAIRENIPKHVAIIEDAACAAGAAYRGKSAGTLGDLGAFSFHPRKTITTGEGGMITTNNDHLAETINQLRNHGATVSEEQRHLGPQPYLLPDFNILGYNYRMTDMQGAVGLVQLNKLDALIEQRRHYCRYYKDQLQEIDWLILPDQPEYACHSWQAFVCLVDPKKAPMPRNEIMAKLYEKGISTRPGTHSVPHLNFYKEKFGTSDANFPMSLLCEKQTIALPLHNKMSEEDLQRVAAAIKEVATCLSV